MTQHLDEFTKAYICAALWSSVDGEGKPLDGWYTLNDIAPETLRRMEEDCKHFQRKHHDDILTDLSRAGHDFWLTRNRHGSGFWDGDWPEPIGERLTNASRSYGEVNLSVGDDGKIYDF